MANQTGIALYIKAFIPTGKDLDAQYAALTAIKEAKTSGKFDAALAVALDIEVKTETKTRRVDEPKAGGTAPAVQTAPTTEGQEQETVTSEPEPGPASKEDLAREPDEVPDFSKVKTAAQATAEAKAAKGKAA